MAIFKTVPYFAYPIWSGKKLNEQWNKSSADPIGESWEISVLKGKSSLSASAEYPDIPMDELIAEHSEWTKDGVSLLFKFISTDDNLSVQVHPDDSYALEHENSLGKTESWYILDAEPDAAIYLGLKEDVSKEYLSYALKNGHVLDLLNKIKVKKGDYYFIPAGTIHALGKGVTVAEIQQSSNVTYRLYDYNRLQNGKPRELHIEKSLDVCSLKKTSPEALSVKCAAGNIEIIKKCDYFISSILKIDKNSSPVSYFYEDYSILTVLSGKVSFVENDVKIDAIKGDTVFLSAASKAVISTDSSAEIYINTPAQSK